jgi:hypothetical protein
LLNQDFFKNHIEVDSKRFLTSDASGDDGNQNVTHKMPMTANISASNTPNATLSTNGFLQN